MREVVKMGSSLDSSIQLTGDCPSANENGKMPLLNLEVWVENNKLMYENYRKPMSNQLLMLEMSAMPAGKKNCSHPRSGANQEEYSSRITLGDKFETS